MTCRAALVLVGHRNWQSGPLSSQAPTLSGASVGAPGPSPTCTRRRRRTSQVRFRRLSLCLGSTYLNLVLAGPRCWTPRRAAEACLCKPYADACPHLRSRWQGNRGWRDGPVGSAALRRVRRTARGARCDQVPVARPGITGPYRPCQPCMNSRAETAFTY